MSRGGRGGGGAGAGRPLFQMDPDLEEFATFSRGDGDDPFVRKDLFQDVDNVVVQPAPITERERKIVQRGRDMMAKRRAGPFWTGDKEDWMDDCDDADANKGVDLFNNAPTFGKKRQRKGQFKLVDPKKIKVHRQFFPKELQDIFGDDPNDPNTIYSGPSKAQPMLGLAKKSALDKLARFEDDDDEAAARAPGDDPEDDDDADPDAEAEPQDDEFDEDEDDADNDYNAEQFFDNGEEDFEEAGADDFGAGGGDDGTRTPRDERKAEKDEDEAYEAVLNAGDGGLPLGDLNLAA